jgi:uncharacterized membrane protein
LEQVVAFLFKYRAGVLSKGQFGFGWRPSVPLVLVIVLGIALLLYFLYAHRSMRLSPGSRVSLMTVRLLLIALMVFCLMRPVVVVSSVIPQSNYVAVLMDDSASMRLPDDGGRTRLDSIKQLMTADNPFYKALSEKFKVRPFRFAAGAQRVASEAELTGSGEQTNLVAAIEQAVRDSAGLPLSGVIVLSDGASNAEGDSDSSLTAALGNLRARGLPVFTVGVGQTRLDGDVELVRATAPPRVLAGSSVTAELLVRASGSPRSVKIDTSEDNHLLRSQPIPVQGDATTVARITFTPSSPGLHRYTFTAAPDPNEPVQENNTQEILIDVADGRAKILYIEGEPRWEYGKLRRAVDGEKNLVLVSVLRSADGKFYRQGIEKGDELASGFPKSEEELFKYDAIILGSMEATFFTFDQLRTVEQFVSRRGGAFSEIGGPKAFNAGGYANTPIADLLPVVLSGEAQQPSESQTFKAGPSERGRDHPAARLQDDPDANAKAWEQMPPITLPDVLAETKPGATVILEARSTQDKNRVVPLLVEERYGRGRTLALMASDTWRWRMMLEFKNKSYETFWRNLLRHIVESVRQRVEASTQRSFYGRGEQVNLRVEVADEKFINVRDAAVVARVTSPSGVAVDVSMKPTTEGGFEGYTGSFVTGEDGVHNVDVSVRRGAKAQEVATLGGARTSFIVGSLNREAHDAAQNQELLKRFATETGGKYYTAEQTDNLIEDLTHTEGSNSVRVAYDLWDMPINFLLAIGLAAGEWFIRKRRGLA